MNQNLCVIGSAGKKRTIQPKCSRVLTHEAAGRLRRPEPVWGPRASAERTVLCQSQLGELVERFYGRTVTQEDTRAFK